MKRIHIPTGHINRILRGRESGISLIETLVAVAILGAVGCVFLSALITSTNAAALAEERAKAKSIAETQLEFISQQDYQNSDLMAVNYAEAACPDTWSADITVEPVDIDGAPGNDDGIQKITVEVYHHGELILPVSGYKAEHGDKI